MSRNIGFLHYLTHLRDKLTKKNKTLNFLQYINAPLKLRVIICKLIAASTLSFGSLVFSCIFSKKSHINTYEKLFYKSLKTIIRMPKYFSNKSFLLILNVNSLKELCELNLFQAIRSLHVHFKGYLSNR